MERAILFDLDGTLLDVDFDGLLKEYFALLAGRLSDLVPAEHVARTVWAATDAMMRNTDSTRSNLSLFWERFCADTGCAQAAVEPVFDRFYEERFGGLSHHARRIPQARPLVEWILARGDAAVVATQPIFPLAAIRHRLRWAGLDDLPFRLITTCEVMHACKPSPAYYREICDLVGVAPERCLMVGDDAAMDLPARAVGMRTYFLGTPDIGAADFYGPLDGVREVLESTAF